MTPARTNPDTLTCAVYGTEIALKRGGEGAHHAHARIQLIYAVSGLVSIEVGETMYVVPPGYAIWVPSNQRHRVWGDKPVRLVCLYIAREIGEPIRSRCEVIFTRPLLRELLLQIASEGEAEPDPRSVRGRRAMVLLDELASTPAESLRLPLPADRRARKVADALLRDPSLRLSIEDWGTQVGASSRTVSRLFLQETGLSLGDWRQQLHVSVALRELATGKPVTHVALDLGYETASAFIAMFRRRLGTTPARYFPKQVRKPGD